MMGMGSWVHWAVVAGVVLLLFGKGRISALMGDLGKSVKEVKNIADEASKPLKDEEDEA